MTGTIDRDPCEGGECILGFDGHCRAFTVHDLPQLVGEIHSHYHNMHDRPRIHPMVQDYVDTLDEWELMRWHVEPCAFSPNCGGEINWPELKKAWSEK